MTLQEWVESHKRYVHHDDRHQFPYVIDDLQTGRADLWHLDDHVVTSVSGGSIWLMPRIDRWKVDR